MHYSNGKLGKSVSLRDRVVLALARMPPYKDILGIDVRAFLASREERAHIFLKLESALQLIATYHAIRFAQIQKDVPRIVVKGLLGPVGCWNPRLKTCEIDFEFLTAPSTTVAAVASTIVHEATHARLYRLGFGYEEINRPRIERICVRAERAFARRLPDGAALVRKSEQMLESIGVGYTFTDREFYENDIEQLRKHGCPEWLVRLADRWARRRKGW